MKLYFLLLFIIFSFIPSYSQIPFGNEMVVTRISTNFNGTSYNNNTLLVYGQGGIILKSSDFGENWTKIQLNDSLNIVDMVNDGSSFYGICSNNYLIISNDNGSSWDKINLSNSEFYQMILQNDTLFLLSQNKIQVYNNKIEKIKEIPFQSDTNYFNFTIVNNYFVTSGGFGKITIINRLNGSNKNINLNNLGVCSNCPLVSKIIAYDNNSFIFVMGLNVYRYNLLNDKIEDIANLKKTFVDGASFTSLNGKLYNLYSRKNIYNLDSLFFYEIDPISKNTKRINNNKIDRYINNLFFTHLNFINNDSIIAVGKNNLIYMSYNGGLSWDLKSFMGNYGQNIFAIDDNNAYALAKYAQIFHTNNAGVTWLPQKEYSRKFFDNPGFQYPNNYGGTFNFKDKNNGFIYIDPEYVGDTNIVITNDGGNSIKLKSKYDFYLELSQTSFNFLNKFYIVSYGNLPHSGGDFTILFRLDDTLGIENKLVLKDYLISNIIPINNELYSIGRESNDEQNAFSIFKSSNEGQNWNRLNTLNIEVGNNDIFWWFSGATEINKDLFLFFNKAEVIQNDTLNFIICYLYNNNTNTFKEIYKINGYQNYNFYKINDNYYTSYLYYDKNGIANYNLMTSKNFFDDIPKWESIKYLRFTQPILRSSNNDSIFYFSSYDSLTKNSVLFLAKKKNINNVEEYETVENSQIYLSNPYPIPSNGNLYINIFWDQSLKIDDIQFELTDILGKDFTNSLTCVLIKKNNYSGILEININNLLKGIYIISCKIDNKRYSKPIIIQ